MGKAVSPTKSKRQPSAAFMKPVQPDEKLAAVIGGEPISRTEVTRKLWDYIRSHNLQDPENKTLIKADDQLREVFDGRERVTMFEMTKLVFNHVKK
jgi:upstream activation factor subunit UAF30